LSLVKILSTGITFPFLSDYRVGLIAAVWIIVPGISMVFQRRKLKAYGISLPGWKQSLIIMLISGLVLLSAYLIGYYIFSPVMPEGLALLTINTFLFVALPEEFFFRGYLQSELNTIFGKKFNFLSAEFGPALYITAVIFTLSHIFVQMNWSKAGLIFLSLVLGWIREKSGNIFAAAGFHTLANVTYVCSQELIRI
jgi:membrane protease YdiL (CAAX protease family)